MTHGSTTLNGVTSISKICEPLNPGGWISGKVEPLNPGGMSDR